MNKLRGLKKEKWEDNLLVLKGGIALSVIFSAGVVVYILAYFYSLVVKSE